MEGRTGKNADKYPKKWTWKDRTVPGCRKAEGYYKVRRCGTSYVISCTQLCRQMGIVEGEYVRIIIERIDGSQKDGDPGGTAVRVQRADGRGEE